MGEAQTWPLEPRNVYETRWMERITAECGSLSDDEIKILRNGYRTGSVFNIPASAAAHTILSVRADNRRNATGGRRPAVETRGGTMGSLPQRPERSSQRLLSDEMAARLLDQFDPTHERD